MAFFFKERKQKVLSDIIHFTVPKDKNEIKGEVLNVCEEPVPDELLGLF